MSAETETKSKSMWVFLLGVALLFWPLLPLYSGYFHVRGGKWVLEWVFAFQQQGINLPDPMWEIYMYIGCMILGAILIIYSRRMD